MSFKKFGDKDIIINTMRAYPLVEFLIFDSRVFYNGIPEQSGVLSHDVYNVPEGHISLYEYNIDRPLVNTDRFYGDSTGTGSYITKKDEELTSPGFVSSLLNN